MIDLVRNITETESTIPRNLVEISQLDEELFKYFQNKFLIKPSLTRKLVSFQANKERAAFRWYRYKEAFSADLVEQLINYCNIKTGNILDPFAGMGTTLFTASQLHLNADGIELLPIGQQIIDTRICLGRTFNSEDFEILEKWLIDLPWRKTEQKIKLPGLRITEGAYPPETADAIERYLYVAKNENPRVQTVLTFALLCILESISYTRKDGQYLRWDYRSGKRQGSAPFNKGNIQNFDDALINKLEEILKDSEAVRPDKRILPNQKESGNVDLFYGSCLDILPLIEENSYDGIITSPPYCNRYDYTRTYALELALLGVTEEEISSLRQQMLSCTVENRAKDLITMNPNWRHAIAIADNETLLQSILSYLENQKKEKKLNNNGIPRMVKGYFYEMTCVISECYRVLKQNAPLIMVNDNVRYAGASISVDMILSHIAENLGFRIENILVLPQAKGNSSQQMGEHGRESLRKCVYIWRKR